MKFALAVLVLFCHFNIQISHAESEMPIALVYTGSGACQGCDDAAAEVPAQMGYRIRFVKPNELTKESFKDVAIWIQPGGNAIRASKALGPKGLQLIRDFVNRGGGYLGFCAGAFLTDTTTDYKGNNPGLGFVPGTQDYYKVQTEDKPVLININYKGTNRKLYFNHGGYFDFQNSPNPPEVIGWYEGNGSMPRMPAAVFLHWGKGKVAAIGAHPESTVAWKMADDLHDPDGSDLDIVEDMVKMVLPESPPDR